MFDAAGNRLFGPSPEALDRFEAVIDGEDFVIDLDSVICEPPDREPCPSQHRYPEQADDPVAHACLLMRRPGPHPPGADAESGLGYPCGITT